MRDGANAAGRAGGRIPGGRSRPGGFTVLRKFLRIMNATCRRFGLPLLAGVLLTAASVLPAQADVTRTQTLPLRRGWNAVWLEVIPSNPDRSRLAEPSRAVRVFLSSFCREKWEIISNPPIVW